MKKLLNFGGFITKLVFTPSLQFRVLRTRRNGTAPFPGKTGTSSSEGDGVRAVCHWSGVVVTVSPVIRWAVLLRRVA